jgi:DNA-directed RNA polymerase subunit M/transcription elongation factor TFIIS
MDKYIPIQKNRKRVYEKVYSVLLENSEEDKDESLKKMAINIERGIFNNTLEESKEKSWNEYFKTLYINKAVNLYMNLNPKSYIKNVNYIKNVLDKKWNEFELPKLSAEDRFNELYPYCEKCEYVHYIKLECDVKVKPIKPEDLPDGQFRCRQGRCRSWKTVHYEVQLRSADEPCSVFVTCQICKSRYRAS